MRIFFDDNKKILGVSMDDNVSFPYLPANQIYCPFVISDKLTKTTSVMRQKLDVSGFPLFTKVDGSETRDAKSLGTDNQPIITNVSFSRPVSFLEAPGEWTLDDVLASKYANLAQGKNYWMCEFTDEAAIDFSISQVNTGFFGASILPGGVLQFKSIKLASKVSVLTVYVEAGHDRNKAVDVEVSVDGLTFVDVADLNVQSDTFIFRISDSNNGGVPTPIHAFAVFY
jgi:hypothetical protein